MAAAKKFSGGITAYCRERNIGRTRLHYWQRELSEQRGMDVSPASAAVGIVACERKPAMRFITYSASMITSSDISRMASSRWIMACGADDKLLRLRKKMAVRGHAGGAEASALFYSFVVPAKVNCVNPYEALKTIFSEFGTCVVAKSART